MMEATPSVPPVQRQLALRIAALRAERALSLEDLAKKSGVSRSMISLIERAQSSPTAVVLERLATALGVTLASLFDAPAKRSAPSPLSRRADQIEWRDPASGYVRRNVSPAGSSQPVQIVEVSFPAGGHVAFENAGHAPRVHQQVWVLEGSIDVSVDVTRYRLRAGDCLAMRLDRPTMFHNPTRKPARYAVVLASDTHGSA